MKIEDLTSEEKQQLLTDLLKDQIQGDPVKRTELISQIESLGKSSIERDIESWAKRNF